MRYQELLEAVKPPEYQAKARYDYFNRTLFNGELPEIPIQFKNLKNVGGVVNVRMRLDPTASKWNKYRGATIIPGSLVMTLSSRFLRSQEQQDAILIHEMIHVHFFTIGDFAEDHGGAFIRMARDLGAKVGFEIPLKDEVADLVAADTTLKTVVVMVVNRDHGGRLYAPLTPSVLTKMDELKAATARLRWGDALKIYKITSPAWSDFALKNRIQRTLTPTFFIETEKRTALLDELARDGQLIVT